MKSRIRTSLVHGLHLFVIAFLGYLVVRDIRQDGQARLFQSMQLTQGFAEGQMEMACEKLFDLVRSNTEAYYSSYNEMYLNRAVQTDRLCDSTIQITNDSLFSPLLLDSQLITLRDSLCAHVKGHPELNQRIHQDLTWGGSGGLVKCLSNARVTQQAILRHSLSANVLLAKWRVMNYFLMNTAGCDLRFDVFEPIWLTDVICPAPGQTFAATGFLSTYTPLSLQPRRAKVWLNGAIIPVTNNSGQFTTRFDQAGPQPLAIRIEVRKTLFDSLQVFEKTYTVNVK